METIAYFIYIISGFILFVFGCAAFIFLIDFIIKVRKNTKYKLAVYKRARAIKAANPDFIEYKIKHFVIADRLEVTKVN